MSIIVSFATEVPEELDPEASKLRAFHWISDYKLGYGGFPTD